MLAVDEQGRPVSGDKIIALFAVRLPRYRRQGAVVMTRMTNLGVEDELKQQGVAMHRTEVGDSRVYAALLENGLLLGGEQSGHIIMRDLLPTGDGIAAGLQLARLIADSGRPLSELAAGYVEYPQQLTNLRIGDRAAWQRDKPHQRRLLQIQRAFPRVRFYLRPSGTEHLVRVLTEARDAGECQTANRELCTAIQDWDRG
jgi:phosphoglucosamine mutase